MMRSIWPALFGLAVIVAGPAAASTTDFNFTSGTGANGEYNNSGISNSTPLTYTLNGITLTATAYATANNSSTTFTGNPTVGSYAGYGLGVCSAADGSNCPGNPPQHQIDNSGSYEFILFTFSTPVSLNSIILANFGTTASTIDMDLSYWVNPSSLTTIPAAATNVFCGDPGKGAADQHATCPTVQGNGTNDLGAGSMTDTLTGTNVTSLLVGAYSGSTSSPADQTSDYFKIQELNVTTISATPEPATFGLIGFALTGIGLLARRRKQS